MNIFMTRNTSRNNIKPMLWFVTFMVMILLCLMITVIAFQSLRMEQFASTNRVIDSIMGFCHFGMSSFNSDISSSALFALIVTLCACFSFFSFTVLADIFAMNLFAVFSFIVFLVIQSFIFFVFLGLLPLPFAIFTATIKAVFPASVLIKFRCRFDLFAHPAIFCYDSLRHGFLHIRKSCLEPVARYILAVGSFHYIQPLGRCQWIY